MLSSGIPLCLEIVSAQNPLDEIDFLTVTAGVMGIRHHNPYLPSTFWLEVVYDPEVIGTTT